MKSFVQISEDLDKSTGVVDFLPTTIFLLFSLLLLISMLIFIPALGTPVDRSKGNKPLESITDKREINTTIFNFGDGVTFEIHNKSN